MMVRNKLQSNSKSRDWPPSGRLRLVILLLMAYVVLSAVIVCFHTDLLLYRLSFSLDDPSEHIITGSHFNHVMFIPRVAAWSGVAGCFALSFLC